MHAIDDTPDRRYWTAYDHFKVEQEARAMRYAEMTRLFGNLWKAMRESLARAGQQPVKSARATQ